MESTYEHMYLLNKLNMRRFLNGLVNYDFCPPDNKRQVPPMYINIPMLSFINESLLLRITLNKTIKI